MRAFLRHFSMCLHLLVTAPLYWVLVAATLLLSWRYRLPSYGVLTLLFLCAALSLLSSVFLESRGTLKDRMAFPRAGLRVFYIALTAAAVASLMVWGAMTVISHG